MGACKNEAKRLSGALPPGVEPDVWGVPPPVPPWFVCYRRADATADVLPPAPPLPPALLSRDWPRSVYPHSFPEPPEGAGRGREPCDSGVPGRAWWLGVDCSSYWRTPVLVAEWCGYGVSRCTVGATGAGVGLDL